MDVKNNDKNYIANTYARADVTFVSGKNSILVGDDGKEYIDFGTGIAVNGLGIAPDGWVEAVTKQLNALPHASNLYYTEPQSALAEILCKRTGMKKIFFCNSGAEANEGAIKCARKYAFDKKGSKNNEIITLVNSFHGRTMTTLSATGQDVFHDSFHPFPSGFKYVPANDYEAMAEAVNENTCAIMLELVQGEGGVMPLNKDYVQAVESLCSEKDIILIIDEVQTGNGRTGSLYAFQQFGITPDIVTTAKGLGNGLPIGAVMMGEKVKDVLVPGTHGSTFGGNPVACAGAIWVLNNITDELLLGVQRKSEYIKSRLLKCAKVKSVTGLGFMIGIECDDAKDVLRNCLERGLVVLTAKNKVRLLPALNIDEQTLERGLKILTEALQ